jgi:hypothetical protein
MRENEAADRKSSRLCRQRKGQDESSILPFMQEMGIGDRVSFFY